MEADEKIFKVWNQFDFNVDPINAETEKEKFFKNKDYNPQFKYPNTTNLTQFKKNLQNLNPDRSLIGRMINGRGRSILNKIEMLLNRKAENFTQKSIDVFGKPNKKVINLAKNKLRLNDEFEIKNLSAKDATRIILRALSEHKLKWNVALRGNMSANAKVDASDKIIYIKREEKFSSHAIERLIVHEIFSHIFRMENATLQKYKIFQVGFPNYLETEEGLAALNEEKTGYLLQNKIQRLYAGRVFAVNLALGKNFSDVFASLKEHFPEEDAWNLTVRVKRGLADTSEPGGFTKDFLYLAGKGKLKDFLKKQGKIIDIYAGRIGTEHISALKESNSIRKAFWLPNNLKQKQ